MKKSYISRPAFDVLVLMLALIFMSTVGTYAAMCAKWGEGEGVGVLDHLQIDEASGIAVSKKNPGRLYHINDSGGGPFFYITDMSGGNTKRVKIKNFDARRADFEDAATGKCFSSKSCFFIADIGDNAQKRQFVEVLVIEELEQYGKTVLPLKRVKIVYPDRAHNAEGMAVHPNGDIYILTKEEDQGRTKAYPAGLYRLRREKWESAGGEALQLEPIGEIDFTRLSSSDSVFSNIVTSFDIAPDGKSFLVLTYENAYEFNIDLAESGLKPARQMKNGIDYKRIELTSLPQQESLAYLDRGEGFLYNSEYHLFEVPIMRVECLDEN